ncbi:MAG: hypothetical protein C4576_19700 [Desulfobacteraceae bacterium]|nr:MAG: hypothetical protein C4576_19700 [Desulfobacteraceae bacterium]
MSSNTAQSERNDNGKRRPALNTTLAVPPQDIEAEQALLCGCVIRPQIIPEAQLILNPRDFYREAHKFIFEAMCLLGADMTPVTLADKLNSMGRLEQIGGAPYLYKLADVMSTSAGWKYHAEIIRDHAQRRKVIKTCWRAAEQAGNGSISLAEVLSGLNRAVGTVSQGKLSPFTENQTSIVSFICVDPPETEYLIEGVIPRGVVGAIIGMGGVSKSFFEITLGIGLATGKPVLKHFIPTRPVKTLALFAEDPDAEIHRRVHHSVSHIFQNLDLESEELLCQNLHMKSVMGCIKPLMKIEQGNPVPSEYFSWLRRTIETHKDLEVLILDPKSRFYGLDENSNDDNTAFVSCLEELVRDYALTILFSHHVSKQSGGALNQTAARGGSALVDACRWVANLRTMDEQTAKKYDLEDFRTYVEFDVSKSNYAPRLPATIYFKRGEHGVLVPVNLEFQRLKSAADRLCFLLQEEGTAGNTYTEREIIYEKAGKEIREQMKETGYTRRQLSEVVDFAIREGTITVQSMTGSGKRSRGILFPEKTI